MSKIEQLTSAWTQFVERYSDLLQKSDNKDFQSDPEWPSPCEYERLGEITWRPVLQTGSNLNTALTFANVEQALNIKIDEQYATFFTLFFSDNLTARHEFGPLEFLQPWSESDFSRLQQNLIGHLMMKQKLKQSETLFFALTDEEDLNLVVDNQTGEVCLEYVGKAPHKVVAKDLVSFIEACEPV